MGVFILGVVFWAEFYRFGRYKFWASSQFGQSEFNSYFNKNQLHMTPKRLIENPLILNEENFLLQRHLHCVKNADIEEVVDFKYNKGKKMMAKVGMMKLFRQILQCFM